MEPNSFTVQMIEQIEKKKEKVFLSAGVFFTD